MDMVCLVLARYACTRTSKLEKPKSHPRCVYNLQNLNAFSFDTRMHRRLFSSIWMNVRTHKVWAWMNVDAARVYGHCACVCVCARFYYYSHDISATSSRRVFAEIKKNRCRCAMQSQWGMPPASIYIFNRIALRSIALSLITIYWEQNGKIFRCNWNGIICNCAIVCQTFDAMRHAFDALKKLKGLKAFSACHNEYSDVNGAAK